MRRPERVCRPALELEPFVRRPARRPRRVSGEVAGRHGSPRRRPPKERSRPYRARCSRRGRRWRGADRGGRRRDARRCRRRSRRPSPRATSTATGSESIATTGPNPSFAAATARTPEPQPASRRLAGSIRDSSSMQARVVGCAPVPNARPGSTTTAVSPAGGGIQGGPIHNPPARAGLWNAFQRSSQPSGTGSERTPGNTPRSSPSWRPSVYTTSSVRPPWTRSSKPAGKRSRSHARAISRSSDQTVNETRLRSLSGARS